MITKGIVQLRLQKQKLQKYSFEDNYFTTFLSKLNYKDWISELNYISSLMRKDFDWDGIPDEATLHSRFYYDSYCLLSFYNDNPIGWIWANKKVTPLWEDSIMNLGESEIYVGGAYLSKTLDRPKDSGQVFYSIWFDYFTNTINNDTAYSYVDEWNVHSLKLAYNIGMERYNFIK